MEFETQRAFGPFQRLRRGHLYDGGSGGVAKMDMDLLSRGDRMGEEL
jgi:hypothetical protein